MARCWICGTLRKLAAKYAQSFDNRRQFFRIGRIILLLRRMLLTLKLLMLMDAISVDVINTNIANPNSGASL
ncbi:hypothetical protein [Yersinia aleksiciae]|uniref:hypothetical protein n=1 Tax=Yersinia aleksiciae TaxID=263819 RepID=UPI000A9D74D7|nr:hypothetical protein [Yersinia aleksiciae]MDA5497758.1 hypothetical protein [Yersinia aleksiciae]NIL00798.1 hypothetical protein [Yersinia aleksiciae]WQC70075.1 hypothetical protein N0K21_15725 [Yersinia aleksiciae]